MLPSPKIVMYLSVTYDPNSTAHEKKTEIGRKTATDFDEIFICKLDKLKFKI